MDKPGRGEECYGGRQVTVVRAGILGRVVRGRSENLPVGLVEE